MIAWCPRDAGPYYSDSNSHHRLSWMATKMSDMADHLNWEKEALRSNQLAERPCWCFGIGRPNNILLLLLSQQQSCLTLCNPMMDWARQAPLSFTISWSLLKLMSIESVMLSNHLILSCPLLLLHSIFPNIKVFSLMSWLFPSGGQSIGASAPASVLSMNIQVWFLQDWLIWSPCCPRDSQESSPAP